MTADLHWCNLTADSPDEASPGHLADEMLLAGRKPKEVAEATGLSIHTIYRRSSKIGQRKKRRTKAKRMAAAGIEVKEVAAVCGFSKMAVYRMLREMGIEPATRRRCARRTRAVLALAEDGHSLAEIARRLGVTRHSVWLTLDRHGDPRGETIEDRRKRRQELRRRIERGDAPKDIARDLGISRSGVYNARWRMRRSKNEND